MSIELYSHNQETYEKMLENIDKYNKFCIQRPTGSGKSFIFLKFLEEHPHMKTLIVSPSIYIFNQLKIYQKEANIHLKNAEYITFSKLALMDELEIEQIEADFIVIDEFHRCGATEWGRGIRTLMETHPDSKFLGTSATPIRYLDSCRDMAEELFDGNYIEKMTISEALAQEILPSPTYVASYYSLLGELNEMEKRLERRGNENLKYRLANKIRKAKSMLSEKDFEIKNIFKKHIADKSGKYIVFCSSEEKLQQMMIESDEWFSEINCEIHKYKVISSVSNSRKQFELFEQDQSEAIKLLFCVNMLNEGVHVDDISGVIFFRSTQSMNVYYQQLGRALSCSKTNKKPIIFDLVNNFENANPGNMEEGLLYQIRNDAYAQNSEIEFEIYDYILDIGRELNEIKQIFEENWEQNFESLKDFIKENNKLPSTFDEQNDFAIGRWCSMQRVQKKNGALSSYREKKLEEIGFVWTPQKDAWFNRYELIKEFKEKNGKLPTSSDNKSFVVWFHTQRTDYANDLLSDEKIKLLKELGVDLEMTRNEKAWLSKYDYVCKFLNEKGALPQFEDTYNDIKIGSWLCEQRKLYKKSMLSHDRQQKLEEIGVVFGEKTELIFDNNLELLKEYLSIYGEFPNSSVKYKDFKIGLWCTRQRENFSKGKLKDFQIEKLKDIGFDFRTTNEVRKATAFEKNYQEYVDFYNVHKKRPTKNTNGKSANWYFSAMKKYQEGKLASDLSDKFEKIMEL